MPVRRTGLRGSVRWRGTSWEIVHTIAGKQHFYTYAGDRKDEAGAWSHAQVKYAELVEEMAARDRGVQVDTRMSGLVKDFRDNVLPEYTSASTVGAYRSELKLVEQYFVVESKDPRVRDVSRVLCTKFRDWRKRLLRKGNNNKGTRRGATRPSPDTVRKSVVFLHLLFERALELELTEQNPAHKPRKRRGGRKQALAHRRRPVIIGSDAYHTLLRECLQADANPIGGSHEPPEFLFAYALTSGEAGLRPESETLWLRWTDLDFDGDGNIWVDSDPRHHTTKTDHGRWVPMTPALRKVLLRHQLRFRNDGTGSIYVFHYTKRGARRKPGDRIQCMRKRILAAAARAKLPPEWIQYDLRHRRITLWLADRMPIMKVMEAAGHASPNTTKLYLHFVKEHLAELSGSTTVSPDEVEAMQVAAAASPTPVSP